MQCLDYKKQSAPYLKPEVVHSLVRYLSMVITDVALPNQAVHGSLVGVSAIPQHSAVVKTEFVLWSGREAKGMKEVKKKIYRWGEMTPAWPCLTYAGVRACKRHASRGVLTACLGCSCTPETRSWSLLADVALCSPPAWSRSDRRSAGSSRSQPTQGGPLSLHPIAHTRQRSLYFIHFYQRTFR